MEVRVQSVHFDADQKLIDFIQERMDKLGQYYDRILAGEVTLRLDKNDHGENKIAEIKLEVPGKDLFAKKQCKTFEEATDEATEALRRQIQKHKAKHDAH